MGRTLEEIGEWLRQQIDRAATGDVTVQEINAFTRAASTLHDIYAKRDIERQLKSALRELAKLKPRGTRG